MNLKQYNYIIFIAVVLASLVIVAAAFMIYKNSQKVTEPFIPVLRRMYRPYIRNTRIYTTNSVNYITSRATTFFKKIGFM